MKTLRLISAIALLCASGPAMALADPSTPSDPAPSNGHGCISTDCKTVLEPGEEPDVPMPPPTICMDVVTDDSIPPEDQWDGCVLP